MRIALFAYPWRVSGARSGRSGGAFWRVAVYGATIAEPCECDKVQSCLAWRTHGRGFGWDDDGTYWEYDPSEDCECVTRAPHRHWRIGMLFDRPTRRQ